MRGLRRFVGRVGDAIYWPAIHIISHGLVAVMLLGVLWVGDYIVHKAAPGDPVIPVIGYNLSAWFLFLDVLFASLVLLVGVVKAIKALLFSGEGGGDGPA